MASRETLLKVNYITDHSCGSYRIGEIDTLPDEAIKQHINRFGEYGFEQLRDFAIRILNVSTKEIYEHRVRGHEITECSATPTPPEGA